MKKETYTCDRCGAELKDGYATTTKNFCTVSQFRYRIRCFKHWNTDSPIFISHDLCEKCRESLEEWLNEHTPYLHEH